MFKNCKKSILLLWVSVLLNCTVQASFSRAIQRAAESNTQEMRFLKRKISDVVH